nr:proline-rich proteoglycan 2-like [Aegilops tauschii subsp. strangulata]
MAPPAPCRSSSLPRLPKATKQTRPAAGPPRPRSGPSRRRQAAPPRHPAANGDAAVQKSAPARVGSPRRRAGPPPPRSTARGRPVPRRWTPERGKARGPPPPASPGPGPQRAPTTAAERKGEGEARGGEGWARPAARGGGAVAREKRRGNLDASCPFHYSVFRKYNL